MNTVIVKRNMLPVLALGLLFTACSPMKQADRRAAQNTVTTIYPQTSFDSMAAKRAIAYGNTTIEGVLFTKPKTQFGYKAPLSQRIYGSNVTIVLYPVTPYFDEWYDLRKKKEGKRTVVYMTEEAVRFCIVTQSDSYGRFKFERMRPGKYFLQAFVNWSESKSYKEYTGSGYDNWGRIDYYQWKNYTQNHTDRVEEFVTVKEDGGVVKVKLK